MIAVASGTASVEPSHSPSGILTPSVVMPSATTSTTGLKVYARLDEGEYQRAVKVSDAEIAAINLARAPRSSSRSWSRRARGGRPEIGVGCAKHQRCGCTLPERSLHA